MSQKRSTIAWLLIFVFGVTALGIPLARARVLGVKVLGEIQAVPDGTFKRFKVSNAFLKRGFGSDSHLVLDIGDTTNINQVITNGVTNTVTNVLIGTIACNVVDSQGNLLGTLLDFTNVTVISINESRERFLALGQGVDIPTNTILGTIQFNDAVLYGSIELTTSKVPRSVSAILQCNGDSDKGLILFNATVAADNPFIPSP